MNEGFLAMLDKRLGLLPVGSKLTVTIVVAPHGLDRCPRCVFYDTLCCEYAHCMPMKRVHNDSVVYEATIDEEGGE